MMVVGLFSAFIYSSINLVRSEHHRVTISAPIFNWLANQDTDELQSLITSSAISSIGRLSIEHSVNYDLTDVERERLRLQQVIVVNDLHGSRVFKLLANSHDNGDMLVGYFTDLYTDANQVAGYLISVLLNKHLAEVEAVDLIDLHISELEDTFNVSITEIVGEYELSAEVLNVVNRTGYSFYPGNEDFSSVGYYKVASGEIYRVDFPGRYSAVSWPLILTLLLVAMSAVGVAVYVLMVSIDRRLKSLETVATRIARGELDARIGAGRKDAIGRLGDAFNSMAEHIQRLVGVQREMIHAVSHELRTPVARIRFGVQMIEDCTNEASLNKQLTGIDSDIQELDELIDEILTYARLEQGGPILTFQDVDVRGIVEQVVSEQGGVKPEMTIQAEFDEGSDEWKQSDVEYRYIHRAIQNLVGNATRYAKSTVKVHCSFDQDACRVDVEDDGSGIPESDWEKVFTPFARLDDSRTRSSGGYGLGLSIVRRILYWHGGQAFLGRSEMGGAKFSLVWPRRQPND